MITELDLQDTIQHCPHDAAHPYAMVAISLIRDPSISPNCRWLIIYLLSNQKGWVIKIPQIAAHVKEFLGRDAVYELINEAIEAGYMMRHEYTVNNLKRYKYFVSEQPKFKKILRHPEFQETGTQYTENTDCKVISSIKNKHTKEDIIATPLEPEKPPVETPKKMPAGGNNKFFKCLDSCDDLSDWQKSLLMKYSEYIVGEAVRYCYHPSTKLEGENARIKQLQSFCKHPEKYADAIKELDDPMKGKTIKEKIESTLKKGSMYNGFEFNFDNLGFYFLHPNGIHTYGCKWKEEDLKNKWNELVKKLGLFNDVIN